MTEPTREAPEKTKDVQVPASKPRKASGAWLFFCLQLVPLAALVAAAAALYVLHGQYQKKEGVERADEVAQYELRRMTALLNYRLNELREEMLHLYGEQSNLARALNEAERERLVFFRRDHLAAYAVLVPGEGGKWELQKYYLRDAATRGDQRELALKTFEEVVAKGKPFAIQRVDSKTFGATWPSGDAYAVAFASNDEDGKKFGLVGIFRPSYVFPFCRFFTDQLGAMPVNAYVLDERGYAVCHSQARLDGSNFKEYQLYAAVNGAVAGAEGTGSARYTNISGTNVAAAVRKVEPGRLTLVSEAAEVSPWATVLPVRELGMVGGAIAVATLLAAAIAARAVGRRLVSAEPAPAAHLTEFGGALPASDGLGLELNEFTKLKRELKELETALLDMQMGQAFVAGFQKAACELPADADPAKFLVDSLAGWGAPLLWLGVVSERGGKALGLGPSVHWGAAVPSFQLGLAEGSALWDQLGELERKLAERVGRGELRLYPVQFGDEPLGVLVVGDASKLGANAAEALPQLCQIFASTVKARQAMRASERRAGEIA